MYFARDVFAHEGASFEIPGGAVLSWITGASLGAGDGCLETPPLD
jgi:hypothetical protein